MPKPRILVAGNMMDLVAGIERAPGSGTQPSMPTADEVADFLERHA
ncbi:MAG: hypothetical protein WBD63_11645 [Phycisphaerae bacterium]|nr:hypothetical protein [Phycisphaerae bacterium]